MPEQAQNNQDKAQATEHISQNHQFVHSNLELIQFSLEKYTILAFYTNEKAKSRQFSHPFAGCR